MNISVPVIMRYNGIRLWANDMAGLLAYGLSDLQDMVEGQNLTTSGKPRTKIVYGENESMVMVFEIEAG